MSSDAVWKLYLDRYGKVYNPVANAKASEEKAIKEAKRKSLNYKNRKST